MVQLSQQQRGLSRTGAGPSSAPHLPNVALTPIPSLSKTEYLNWPALSTPGHPSRKKTLDWGEQFHLESPLLTPQSTRSRVDLRLPKNLGRSKSLSGLVVHANQRQHEHQQRLHRLDMLEQSRRLEPIEWPAASSRDSGDSGLRARRMVDDIGELLSESATVYASSSRARTPMPLREEAKTAQPSRQEEREKQEKRRLELQRKVAAMAESKGEVHRQVLEKIEELRHDRMQREEFDQYVGSLRQRPDEKYVKDNIKAVSNVSPLEFAQQVESAREARKESVGHRRQLVKRQHEKVVEGQIEQMVRSVEERRQHHELGVMRQKAVNRRGRAIAWLAVTGLVHRSLGWGEALEAGRAARELRKVHTAAAAVIKKQWRIHILIKRVGQLKVGLLILRRQVWWWRFRKRIERKRHGCATVNGFLSDFKLSCGAMQVQVRRFMHTVRKVQRAWRAYTLVVDAQTEMLLTHWAACEWGKAGRRSFDPRDADFRMRCLVLREDLRRRKGAHAEAVIAWRVRSEEWEAARLEEELMAHAKQMLTKSAAKCAADATASARVPAAAHRARAPFPTPHHRTCVHPLPALPAASRHPR